MIDDIPKRILIVDDIRRTAENYRDLFRKIGRDADAVFDGASAIKAVKHHEFDLVLLDMRMPDYCGLETLKEMLHHRPRLCIIIFTGYGDVASAVKAMHSGAADMLEKKYTFEQIVSLTDLRYARYVETIRLREAEAQVQKVKERTEIFLDVANTMAHVVKNLTIPIYELIRQLNIVLEERPDLSSLRPACETGDYSYRRMKHFLDRLLRFSSFPEFKVFPTDLEKAIHDGVEGARQYAIRRDLSAKIKFEVTLATGLRVLGDQELLSAAVEFLVQNAAEEYLKTQPKKWQISVHSELVGDAARVTIADNGPGFTEELLDWIANFETTGRVPPPANGRPGKAGMSFGIGLYSAYGVVKACGGTFVATNRPDTNGAQITFTLNRVPPSVPTSH